MNVQHKIVFTGPVGAGKTTAIATISDMTPVSTEQTATDDTRDKKEQTTVAMDYGSIRLDNGEILHLYGMPGQKRFDFMWDLLIDGIIGVVIMLDGSNPSPIDDMNDFVTYFNTFIHDRMLVVGVSKMELGNGLTIEAYRLALEKFGLNIPVFEVDARRHDDILMLVQALLYLLDPGLIGESV